MCSIARLIVQAVAQGTLIPMVCVSGKTGVGLPELIEAITRRPRVSRAELAQAEASVLYSSAELAQAKMQLQYTEVRAPGGGRGGVAGEGRGREMGVGDHPAGERVVAGQQLGGLERRADQKPLVLWNHRWEYDKRPEEFFETLFQLHADIVLAGLIRTHCLDGGKMVSHAQAQHHVVLVQHSKALPRKFGFPVMF